MRLDCAIPMPTRFDDAVGHRARGMARRRRPRDGADGDDGKEGKARETRGVRARRKASGGRERGERRRGMVVGGAMAIGAIGFGARGTMGVSHNSPFTSKTNLMDTLEACLTTDPTGVGCQSLNSVRIEDWDVSQVTDMDSVFKERTQFNANISVWNVGQVQTMYNMFKDAIAFNGTIGAWNVAAATDMQYMFYNASTFDADISAWNVAGVNNMNFMFGNAVSFNRDITVWPNATSSTARFVDMFSGASAWNAAWGRPGRVTNYDGPASVWSCLLYTSPSPRDGLLSRMPSSA